MQVCFIQDYLRATWDGGNADRCGRWLHALVGPTLRQAGFRTFRLGLAHAAVRALRADSGHLPWPTLFSDPASGSYHAALLPQFRHADLVVGFELSPNQMRVLQAAGIPFVDAAIDPIRFGKDIFLALRTNMPALAEAFAVLETRSDAIPRPLRPAARMTGGPAGKTLFVGQTDVDGSLVTGGRIARIDPFLPALAEHLGHGEELWLKPHPHGHRHGSIRTLHELFPRSCIVNDNAYALLASGQVGRVLTLSSGLAAEAAFFGVPATELINPDVRNVADVSRAFRLSPAVLPISLRRATARAVAPTSPRKGLLRSRLGLAWAEPEPSALPNRRVRHGDVIEFGDRVARGPADGMCAFGWSHAEATGRWTDGPLAILLLSPGYEPLDLTLRCRPYLTGDAPLRVTIEVRGRHVSLKRLILRSDRVCDISVALPETDGLAEVAIHVLDPVVPSSMELSGDRRALGLHVMRADLRRRGGCLNWITSASQAAAASAAALAFPGRRS